MTSVYHKIIFDKITVLLIIIIDMIDHGSVDWLMYLYNVDLSKESTSPEYINQSFNINSTVHKQAGK